MSHPKPETWPAQYLLSNVHRELGSYTESITLLRKILATNPREVIILLSLQQTYNEQALSNLRSGLYGAAALSAHEAIKTAGILISAHADAKNLWKNLGDSCLIYTLTDKLPFPAEEVASILGAEGSHSDSTSNSPSASAEGSSSDPTPFLAAQRAYTRVLSLNSNDIHAQSVAYYNLGYISYLTSTTQTTKSSLKTSIRNFKSAIELEAGNSEFWNGLGVAAMKINPRVAQHAFVRSLHLNELNARVWTNLGVLYLLQKDEELAHRAFGRAQSTDPTYASAWVGEGVLKGDKGLASFTHAFEIADAGDRAVKKVYPAAFFDQSGGASRDLAGLIQPLFALEQLRAQSGGQKYEHLSALFRERVGDYDSAIESLMKLSEAAEMEYEVEESKEALEHYAQAKADLARCALACGRFEEARDNATAALDLEVGGERLRLSAHLTAGLAADGLGMMGEAVAMFKKALTESEGAADVFCLLGKVLWAKGGTEERDVAREQVVGCIERNPDHVGCVVLLGAMAALDDDVEGLEAVKEDLLRLRMREGLEAADAADIDRLLLALAGLESNGNELAQAQEAVALHPEEPNAWAELAALSDDATVAKTALRAAQKAVPPFGSLDAAALAKAAAEVGDGRSVQEAVVLAPWEAVGWKRLIELAT